MPYVMVPVPEEHVQEVMRYVIKLLQEADLEDWDEESMRQLFDGSDEITRALLSFVAQPEHAGGVPKDEVAQGLELHGYLPTVMKNLKVRSRNEFGRFPPIRKEQEPGGRGGRRSVPMFVMDEGVAELVRAAEKAVHEAEIADTGAGEGEA